MKGWIAVEGDREIGIWAMSKNDAQNAAKRHSMNSAEIIDVETWLTAIDQGETGMFFCVGNDAAGWSKGMTQNDAQRRHEKNHGYKVLMVLDFNMAKKVIETTLDKLAPENGAIISDEVWEMIAKEQS